jgi:hypothetical protein
MGDYLFEIKLAGFEDTALYLSPPQDCSGITSDNADYITVIMLLSTMYCKQCDLSRSTHNNIRQ